MRSGNKKKNKKEKTKKGGDMSLSTNAVKVTSIGVHGLRPPPNLDDCPDREDRPTTPWRVQQSARLYPIRIESDHATERATDIPPRRISTLATHPDGMRGNGPSP